MAVTKAKKIEQAQKLNADLKNVKNLVVATFNKLTVSQDFALRKTVRSAGGKYLVVKNTIAERAAQGTALQEALKGLQGVTSIAYTEGDPVALAKAIQKYISENEEAFKVKGGVVDGKSITAKEVAALATMPSREEILAKLLFLINAPAQRLVTVMNAVGRDVAVVISQGVEKQKFAQ